MSSKEILLDPPPKKGTTTGDFYHRDQNPFLKLDEEKRPRILETEDELETNDVQFRALKQDVLIQVFEPGLQEDENFPSSGNLFTLGNRSGCFACGCKNGLIFGKTELLRAAFEEAKPKTTASLKNAFNVALPETPTHVRYTGDEKSIIVALPSKGVLILDCALLEQKKSASEATKSSFETPPILDIIPNPSSQHGTQVAYITRTYADSPFGNLFLFDISTQKSERIDSQAEHTCLTFSHDGDILMACTRTGEAFYYSITDFGKVPIRRPSPVDLPQLEGDSWWIIQAVHWIDLWNQLVIYNPLTHPSDDPVHEYQAFIISNPTRLPNPSTFSFDFIKLPSPPVDAFGNNALRPWFWFQNLHNWEPGIQDLVLCSVTAGSDIGLLGRGKETDTAKRWRVWAIEDENRRATVPYNMEKNEETIVAGMQLDFTSTKKLDKPLYPDEDPLECDPLPILWVLNTSGQLAGWTVLYIPGIKAGERPISIMPIDQQDQYWQKKTTERLKNVTKIDEEENRDRELWEKEWRERSLSKRVAATSSQRASETPPAQTRETPVQTPVKPTPVQPSPAPLTPSESNSTIAQPSHPAFGKPSPLGATVFGRTGQLDGNLPGQLGIYSSFATGTQAAHVFGRSTGLTPFGGTLSTTVGGGFAKYTSQTSQGSGFLSGQPSQTGSFLQNSKGGSFLQGGQTSSFLQSGQDQGFGKYVSSGREFGTIPSTTTPSSFSGGESLANRLGSSPSSPFGAPPKGSLNQRTQSLTSPSSRTQSHDLLDDETDTESSDVGVSESDSDDSVRVDALNFGDSGFNVRLDEQITARDTIRAEPVTPVRKDSSGRNVSQNVFSPSTESPSSVGDSEYAKVGIPITPSPRHVPSTSTAEDTKDFTPSGRDKPQVIEVSPFPTPLTKERSLPDTKVIPTLTPSKPAATLVIENTPPDRSIPQLPSKVTTMQPRLPFSPSLKPSPPSTKETNDKTANPIRNKLPLSELTGISSRSSDSANLSDAFRLVIEQVSKEIGKLSENAYSLAEYVHYQNQETNPKSADNLGNPNDWTLADLRAISRIVESDTRSVKEVIKKMPAIDESIHELEKSLKKMEAKKLELDRFVVAVKDPEVRESIYSRKLAPDFARQQKEIRHSLQIAEEKLRDLASALTILKAELADDKGSFGVHSPSTAGIYRVVNNVFSRLQILSVKVITLEKRVPSSKGLRIRSPGDESAISRTSVPPTTPISRIGTVARVSPRSPGMRTSGMNSNPGMRGSPLRKTMLDERLDPWEMDEVIRDVHEKQEFRKKIGTVLKGTRPLHTEASGSM